jgi:Tfp pilus assembly protein PilZ
MKESPASYLTLSHRSITASDVLQHVGRGLARSHVEIPLGFEPGGSRLAGQNWGNIDEWWPLRVPAGSINIHQTAEAIGMNQPEGRDWLFLFVFERPLSPQASEQGVVPLITTPQKLSEQRRRHPRRKVSTIVYLKLDDDNGGILLNVGAGGLSLQAVAGLNPGQDLVLHFKLFDREEMITVAGRVVWLGPTRKEAGICFKNPSDSIEQSIARWIAREETALHESESKAPSAVKPVPAATGMPLPPPQIATTSLPAGGAARDARPHRSTPLPSDLLLGVNRPGLTSRKPSAPLAFSTRFPSPIPISALHPEEHSATSTASPAEVPSEPLQPLPDLEPASQYRPGTEFLTEDRVLPDSRTSTSNGATPGHNWISSMLMSSPQAKWRLQVMIVAGLGACVGILMPLLILTSLTKRPENLSSGAASSGPPLAVSTPAATAAGTNPAVDTAPRSGGIQGPSLPKTLSVPATPSSSISGSDPIAAPPQIPWQPAQTSWLATLKIALLGVEDKPTTLDPAIGGVAVWTDQWSGFYYCANSPYFVRPLRVSVVRQDEALQSGFQPKLGSYCH